MGLPTRTMMRSRNFFALGLTSWLFSRPIEPTIKWIEQRFKKTPTVGEANVARAQGRLQLRRDDRDVPHLVHGAARPPSPPATTATSPATPPRRSASSPRRSSAGRPLFLGSYPITPASDILHELSTLQELRRLHLPGRGRDRRRRRGPRRGVRRRHRADHHQRPGRVPEGRDDQPGGQRRAAADHRRHPARRPEHGPADQDRAGRPAAGPVRPQQRLADADPRAVPHRPIASARRSRRCASR